MSGGHSVIQNNCRYIFIYSFCATPLNYHGYNLKGFRQTFIWSQHTNVNLRVNYGCIEPLLLKEKMKMELRERHPKMSEPGTHALLRSACGSHSDRAHSTAAPTPLHFGAQTPMEGTVMLSRWANQFPNMSSKKGVRTERQSLLQMHPCLLSGRCTG